MADKKISPKGSFSLDDDLVAELKSNGIKESSTGHTINTLPVNATDPGNIKDGTGNPEQFLQGIGFQAVPNPMSSYNLSTYHLSFYLDSDLPSEQDQGNEFVIAETGLTGMNIQEVTINQIVGPTMRTKNAMATDITIRIYEPGGALLPDLLFQAATRKQIRNYLKAPWFLKLKLWGYDENGEPAPVGKGWKWKMMLIDVQTQVSETGAIHTITAMPLAEVALNDQYGMLGTTVSTRGNKTVGDALKNVIDRMNSDAARRYGQSSVPFVQYAVEERPYGFDTKVGVTSPFGHPITSSYPQGGDQTTTDNYDTQTGQFAPGTDFPAVVDMFMSRSETAVKMIRPSRELPPAIGSGPDDEAVIKDVFSVVHRVETKVEYGEYNETWGDYSKKITFVIKPYTTLRLLTSRGRAMNYDKEKTFNTRKAQYAVQKALMKKQYDYLFTGMNTEVLKFDINLNFTWAVSVPQFLAQTTTTGTPASYDPSMSVEELRAANDKAYAQFQSADAALKSKTKEILDANNLADNGIMDGTGKRITAEQRANLDQLAKLRGEADANSRLTAAALGKAQDKTKATTPSRRLPPEDSGRIVDGEDLVYENAQGRGVDGKADTRYLGADQGGASFMPVTIAQDASKPGIRTHTGTPTDNNPNKSIYGALLNQLYGTIDGNLQDVDLEIRGDPYWLGHGDPNEVYDSASDNDAPNFFNGEHIFVFRFKMPVGYDPETGQPTPQTAAIMQRKGGNANLFTGFFAAIEVLHKFSNGVFTQNLKGTRIPGWYYENLIEGREATVAEDVTYDNTPGPSSIPNGTPRGKTNGRPIQVGGGFGDPQSVLAIAMVQEAGGEGIKGMQAVGNVIVNRANKKGRTIQTVITEKYQFSAFNNEDPRDAWNRKKDTAVYQQAYQIAGQVLNNQVEDVTKGADAYLNVAATRQLRIKAGQGNTLPSWYNTSKITTHIGNHTFLKGIY